MIIAHMGEQFMGRDGKVITVAQDIHSGDVNLRPEQFIFADQNYAVGGFLPEEVYEFIRDRLSSPPQEETEEKPATAKAKPAPKASTKAKRKR